MLESTNIHLAESAGVLAEVAETDDLGIWIRVNRPDGKHLLLVRWDYVLSVDLPDRKQTAAGIT